jgi:putative phosphoribosyl transferase
LRRLLRLFHGEPPFRDREDAGRRLAGRLIRYRDERPIVFALPRGGVPVGYEISRALGVPLEVFVARKLGAPGQPEFGIGAVAPGGVRILNEDVVRRLGIPDDYLARITDRETAEVQRRLRYFRGDRPEPDVRGRTVILVDDGLATGVTARAAVAALRRLQPRRLVLAAPVCASQTAELLGPEVDELVCLEAPSDLGAIGFWYRDFAQTSDEEVIELLESARRDQEERPVRVPAGPVELEGNLSVPSDARGVVLFAHGSGSGRHSPRNRQVARALREAGLATLLIDLLTPDEEEADLRTGHLRFDIGLLAQRLTGATDWLAQNPDTNKLRIGYFGASTGAAAALVAAAEREVGAVVSRGGRPDLAGDALPLVKAPTLLIVGGNDVPVIRMNEEALGQLRVKKRLEIIPGATHLFEEPGALEEVARLAAGWFTRHLSQPTERS